MSDITSALNDKEKNIAVYAWLSLKSGALDNSLIDFDRLAEMGGYTNIGSARNAWAKITKKLESQKAAENSAAPAPSTSKGNRGSSKPAKPNQTNGNSTSGGRKRKNAPVDKAPSEEADDAPLGLSKAKKFKATVEDGETPLKKDANANHEFIVSADEQDVKASLDVSDLA